MPHTHIPDLPWAEQRSPTGRFHSYFRNVSLALGGSRNAGPSSGGHPFDLQVRRLPPGASVCPFHLHLGQWELFLVQSGTATVRAGDKSYAVRAGHIFIHPPGEPHQITNSGTTDLEVLIVADNPALDACYYPDSNKWALRPPWHVFRMQEVDYFDGEEPPANDPTAYHPPPPTPLTVATPFEKRLRHIDEVPFESWESPKKNFHGTSKELSIALGAVRNAPTGLGGHPFDVELNKFAPGKAGCPFHSHAAQWELFLIASGTASIRTAVATQTFGPGDAILQPPGKPHQIRNGSTSEDLLFYIIADNPPIDYWHYPDSKKWGLREPRKFFPEPGIGYWDGED
ncbi:MAG TPA: cupin domain-containing protein [Opitutaceae bacterium]|nr:cupin domain-containing protein [Opitutaceae bacterium]